MADTINTMNDLENLVKLAVDAHKGCVEKYSARIVRKHLERLSSKLMVAAQFLTTEQSEMASAQVSLHLSKKFLTRQQWMVFRVTNFSTHSLNIVM